MKTRLLLFLISSLLAVRPSFAQTSAWWCPPGATWEYSYTDFSIRGTLTVRYANDTIVAGQPAQVLRRVVRAVQYQSPGPTVVPPFALPSIITRVVGNDVSFWYNGQFVPLYQFGALPGTSWTTYATYPNGVCPQSTVQVVVDSVGQRMVNGRVLRWQAIHAAGTSWRGRLYEGIGSLVSLQPDGAGCPNTDPAYINPLISFRATGFPAVGGPTLTVLANAETQAAQAGFTAYPNPVTGLLTVQLPPAMHAATLTLRDLSGRRVWQQPSPANGLVNLSALPTGSYWLTAESLGQAPLTRRVVLQ